ncbi:putative lumazine-binding protein [Mycena sanguinolenta]|uniref:Putative lumazine-binding protein n=1 Tax=Mycena sanguinolenta TaxID=230812 RepID=A0A8H6YDR7_9AGAR|nr:putative lumazine-binding protein [Mycena sanguinolenta]
MKYSTAGFTDDQLAVIAVATKFLDGISARDKAGMLSLVLPSGGATLLRNGAPIFTNLVGVVERIPFDHPQEMSEIISGQPTVLIDRDIAMAWTPYEFYFDGVLHHVGTDIWSFLKTDGKWMISGLADNSRAPDEPGSGEGNA